MTEPAVWDPNQYHRFGDLRLRPALELFWRISIEAPSLVQDAGTGGGEIARLMTRRWPNATVIGSDSSHFSLLCRRALREAYPAAPDGTTLFPFRRLFIVARR